MTIAEPIAVSDLPDFMDRVIDVDTHEMIPFHFWAENFGEDIAAIFASSADSHMFTDNGANSVVRPDVLGDDTPITDESVWRLKGGGAPGAIDLHRRIDVMNEMGVARALLFPSFGLLGLLMVTAADFVGPVFKFDMTVPEIRANGSRVMKSYNDWAIRSTRGIDRGRVLPAAMLLTESLDQMMSGLENLIEEGVKAVWLPSGAAPAETSPADPALDVFWRTAADANVAVMLHIGTDFQFMNSLKWAENVPAFVPTSASAEFPLSPYYGATTHMAADNFITTMVLGGVFDRVPDLRFGAVELGAQWLGPLAERLDIWAGFMPKQLRGVISMKPSEYIARNIRVSPFCFEKVDTYFDRYPHLQDCFAYSTDYPHVEGGAYSKRMFYEQMKRHDPAVVEKFFVTNGSWIVPDAQ